MKVYMDLNEGINIINKYNYKKEYEICNNKCVYTPDEH